MLINSEVEMNSYTGKINIRHSPNIRKIRGKITFLKAFLYNAL